jgi:hypothetical protein
MTIPYLRTLACVGLGAAVGISAATWEVRSPRLVNSVEGREVESALPPCCTGPAMARKLLSAGAGAPEAREGWVPPKNSIVSGGRNPGP